MSELVIHADGVELVTQNFGNPAQPSVLRALRRIPERQQP
jgi:hypothetical protein